MFLRYVSSPLQPASAVGLASCCKALRGMPLLKSANAALKCQHTASLTLTDKVGLTPERLANAGRLSLPTKSLTPKHAKVIASIGRFMPHLTELDLRYNGLGDEGLMQLATASAKGSLPELTVLGLSNNRITTKGAEALASAVASSPAFSSLESLNLSHNEIVAEGMASLVTMRMWLKLLDLPPAAPARHRLSLPLPCCLLCLAS